MSKPAATRHLHGWARLSTTGQDLSTQGAALRGAGRTIIRAEEVTGTSEGAGPGSRSCPPPSGPATRPW